jgi:hypothetical protein
MRFAGFWVTVSDCYLVPVRYHIGTVPYRYGTIPVRYHTGTGTGILNATNFGVVQKNTDTGTQ